MIRYTFPHGLRVCPTCGRGIALNRHDRFRRHMDLRTEPRSLCSASHRRPEQVEQVAA